MDFFIDEERTKDFANDFDHDIEELLQILKEANVNAYFRRHSYGSVLTVNGIEKNGRRAGRNEKDTWCIKICDLRKQIEERGAEDVAAELGMTRQGMYARIKRKEKAGSLYF